MRRTRRIRRTHKKNRENNNNKMQLSALCLKPLFL